MIFAEKMRVQGVQEGIQEWPAGSGQILRVADITFAYSIVGAEKVYLPYLLPGYSARKVEENHVKFLNAVDPVFAADKTLVATDSPRTVIFASESSDASGSKARVRSGKICDAPFKPFAERCYGFGWADAEVDPDGSLRRSALVVSHPLKKGFFFPTLSVAAVMNGEPELLSIDSSGCLFHRGRKLPSDTNGHYLIRWEGRQDKRFSCYSAGRVVLSYRHSLGEIDERLPAHLLLEPEAFKDKYVVIGTTMASGHDMKRTPFGGDEPGMVKHLTLIQNLLDGSFMERASTLVVLSVICFFSWALAFVFLFIGSAQRAVGILIGTLAGYVILVTELFIHFNYQMDVTAPVCSC